MDFFVSKMTEDIAGEISKWQYESPYDFYSMDGSEELINELMDGSYYPVLGDNEVVGYFCYGLSAQVPGIRQFGAYDGDFMDIGLGLRPDLTGKGIGYEFLLKGIEFGREKFKKNNVRLTVALVNLRAIKVYERAGFKGTGTYINKSSGFAREFMVMDEIYGKNV